MEPHVVADKYEAMLKGIEEYVDVEKRSTREFVEQQHSMEIDEPSVATVGEEEFYVDDPEPQEYPEPRENVTVVHEYPELGATVVMTGDLLNLSDHDIGSMLGKMGAALVDLCDD